jgi:hypothetical protein
VAFPVGVVGGVLRQRRERARSGLEGHDPAGISRVAQRLGVLAGVRPDVDDDVYLERAKELGAARTRGELDTGE